MHLKLSPNLNELFLKVLTLSLTTHSSRLAGSESPRKVRKLYDYSAIRSASPIQASIKQEIEIYLAADYEENVNIKSALY